MIRPATTIDVAVIAGVETECFRAEAWSDALVLAEVEGYRRTVLVSEVEGTIGGYASISMMDEVADLHRIAVVPCSRRNGVARDLLTVLVDQAHRQGAIRMLLEVAEENMAAISLYQSFGFATISRRRRYYPSGADSLVMALTF